MDTKRPVDWKFTTHDLIDQIKKGKSFTSTELNWAQEYERSLIPDSCRFPKKGDVYESKSEQKVMFMTSWSAPFTGGGESTIYKGERIWIDTDPAKTEPISVYALPMNYDTMEERMVPESDRENPKYGGFYLCVRTTDLNERFRLVQEGYEK